MPLGREVGLGLGPGYSVLDGNPAPLSKRGHSSPHTFRPMSVAAKRLWINMPLGTKVGIGPGHIVQLPQKGHVAPYFRPMSAVVKRSPISATAEYLLGFAVAVIACRVCITVC